MGKPLGQIFVVLNSLLTWFFKGRSNVCQNPYMAHRGMYGCYNYDNLNLSHMMDSYNGIVSDAHDVYNVLANSNQTQISFERTLKPILEHDCDVSSFLYSSLFAMSALSRDDTRNISLEAQRAINTIRNDVLYKEAVYGQLKKLYDMSLNSTDNHEMKTYLNKIMRDRKRAGADLPKNKRLVLLEIMTKILVIEIDFNRNLDRDMDFVNFTKEELSGMPESIMQSFDVNPDGEYQLPTENFVFKTVFETCAVENTRKKMYIAYNSRGKGNIELLTKIVHLRQEMAELLGYTNFAEYSQEKLMAKNPDTVWNFLQGLEKYLQPMRKKKFHQLLEIKTKHCKDELLECSEGLEVWDVGYYSHQLKKTQYSVNYSMIKEYFPVEVVSRKVMALYEDLLGLKFKEVPGLTWAPDITLYEVTDLITQDLIGYFFLDLYVRKGKFKHEAVFTLQPSCMRSDGTRQVPVAVMVTNFQKPTSTMPSLLSHSDLSTFFHEFGHVMHSICSRTEVPSFSGTDVQWDFVEAPSQMLVNWIWEPVILKNMSHHYLHGGQLSDEAIDSLISSRNVDTAYGDLQQIALSIFDLSLHVNGSTDVDKLYRDVMKQYLNLTIPVETHFPGTFRHIITNYAAQYYVYMWSEVFSADMFLTRFKTGGIMNRTVGMDYRKKVLEPGGSKDAIEILRDFLGKEPDIEAYLRLKKFREHFTAE